MFKKLFAYKWLIIIGAVICCLLMFPIYVWWYGKSKRFPCNSLRSALLIRSPIIKELEELPVNKCICSSIYEDSFGIFFNSVHLTYKDDVSAQILNVIRDYKFNVSHTEKAWFLSSDGLSDKESRSFYRDGFQSYVVLSPGLDKAGNRRVTVTHVINSRDPDIDN